MKHDVKVVANAKPEISQTEEESMVTSPPMEHLPKEHPKEKHGQISDSKDLKVSVVAEPAAFSLARDFDTIVGDLDIPQFLKDHQTTLRVPEKVRHNGFDSQHDYLWSSTTPFLLLFVSP